MFRLVEPCTVFDLAEVLERATPAQMGMMRGQLAAGLSFALRDDAGVAVACGGYVAQSSAVGLAWFAVHPERGQRHMRRVLRAIALTLERQPYPSVVIETETPMGQRMARLLGFAPDSACKEWIYGKSHQEHHGHFQAEQFGCKGGGGTSGGGHAPLTGGDGA